MGAPWNTPTWSSVQTNSARRRFFIDTIAPTAAREPRIRVSVRRRDVYPSARLEGGARERTSESSETGCWSQRTALRRIVTPTTAGTISQSAVRMTGGRFAENAGRKDANTTTATHRTAIVFLV